MLGYPDLKNDLRTVLLEREGGREGGTVALSLL